MSLTGDAYRFRRVEEIFHQVTALPAAAQGDALAEICAGDEALEEEVRSLLEASDAVEARLPSTGTETVDPWIGREVGHYRIEELLGRGGMGAVYLASRNDGEFRLQAAVKVLGSRLMGEVMRSRFLVERQILATLSHPNIVRLIDGGVTPAGDAYLVMEYVDGKPVDQWVDEHQPDLRALITLFIKICGAVEAAHRKLVIHRDLKPANILVAEDGEPKLLDFGTSKLLDNQRGSRYTQLGFRAFTPEYASPEQALGDGLLTAASDVYSLGVTLFRLVTGHLPYRFEVQSSAEFLRVLRDTQPPAPSAITRAGGGAPERVELLTAHRRQELRGDLDAIILKALSKEPERRYAGAAEFAEDLQAWLDGRPVVAREPSWSYRAAKFVRRHKVLLTSAVLVSAVCAGGIVATLLTAREARREEARANRQFHDVRNFNHAVLFDFFDAVQALPGSTAVQKGIVDQSLAYINRLQTAAPDDAELAYDLVEAYVRLGNVNGNPYSDNLSNPKVGLEALNRGLAIARALVKKSPGDDRAMRLIGSTEQSIAEVCLGMGDLAGSTEHAHKAVEAFEALAARPWATAVAFVEASSAHGVLSDILVGSFGGKRDAAKSETEIRRAIELEYQALARDPSLQRARRGLAVSAMKLGRLLSDVQPAEAAGYFETALRELSKLPKEIRSSVDTLRLVSLLEWRLSSAANLLGQYDRAIDHSRESVRIAESLARLDPENQRYQVDLANAKFSVANSLDYRGSANHSRTDLEAALEAYRRTSEFARKLSLKNPHNDMYPAQLCETLLRIAQIEFKLGRRSLGAIALNESRTMAARTGDSKDASLSDLERAVFVFSSEDLPAAELRLAQAETYAQRLNGATSYSRPDYLHALASIYQRQNRLQRALEMAAKARDALPPRRPNEPATLLATNIAATLESLGKALQRPAISRNEAPSQSRASAPTSEPRK